MEFLRSGASEGLVSIISLILFNIESYNTHWVTKCQSVYYFVTQLNAILTVQMSPTRIKSEY